MDVLVQSFSLVDVLALPKFKFQYYLLIRNRLIIKFRLAGLDFVFVSDLLAHRAGVTVSRFLKMHQNTVETEDMAAVSDL